MTIVVVEWDSSEDPFEVAAAITKAQMEVGGEQCVMRLDRGAVVADQAMSLEDAQVVFELMSDMSQWR